MLSFSQLIRNRTTAISTRVTSVKSKIICAYSRHSLLIVCWQYDRTESGRSAAAWLRIHQNLFQFSILLDHAAYAALRQRSAACTWMKFGIMTLRAASKAVH